MDVHDVIIIGGGLAGLTAAIDLSRFGHDILVLEANTYPHHKVCGEYVSKEVSPYLKRLGIDLEAAGSVDITDFEMSTVDGLKVTAKLPLGGIGISRYAFDSLLYKKATKQGVTFKFLKVTDIVFNEDKFYVAGKEGEKFMAKVVIGAYGKRSALDKSLKRDFSFKKHSWLAVKGHFNNPSFPLNLVALHNFEGGYGGLSKTETGTVNFCYLVNYQSFKRYNDIEKFNAAIVSKNKYLNSFLKDSKAVFNTPLSIAQISFEDKKPVVEHVLMCGDTAGLIHPLCGNGMAMAIHSARLASEQVVKFLDGPGFNRAEMEKEYTRVWNSNFKKRLWFGRKLQYILMSKKWIHLGIRVAKTSNRLLQYVISKTHGKPIV